MSVQLSSCNAPEFDPEIAYSGREVKEIFYGNERGAKELAEDIFHLRENNHDWCHTNFYYSLLRLALFNADTTDMRTVIFRGFVLNLVLFSVAFVFFALFLREIFGGKKLPIIAALTAGTLVPAMLSMSVWLRPYELWFLTVSLFAYVFALCAKNYLNGSTLVSWKNLWIFAGTLAVTLLSVYFSIIIVVFAGIFLCALALKKIGRDELPFLFSGFGLSLVIATAIYPNYPLGFLIGRGAEAAGKFSPTLIFENIVRTFFNGGKILIADALLLPCAALVLVAGILLIREWRKNSVRENFHSRDIVFAGIFCVMFLSFWAILYLSPYKIVRYVCATVPFFLISVPWIFSKLHSQKIAIAGMLAFMTIFVLGAIFATPRAMTDSGDTGSLPCRPLDPKINHLVYRKDAGALESLKNLSAKNTPVVFVEDWRLHGLDLMKISDSTRCFFVKPSEENPEAVRVPANENLRKFILVVPTWGRPSLLKIREILLPHGHIGEEFSLDVAAVAFEFSADDSAEEIMLKLNVDRATNEGKYFDRVPAK